MTRDEQRAQAKILGFRFLLYVGGQLTSAFTDGSDAIDEFGDYANSDMGHIEVIEVETGDAYCDSEEQ